ncbi:acyltransferase [Psychroserpens sp.]|uniref:acyltransferase n=1 Tax=Psychroserpens sp. TaxID=2020870 RepID=UPI00385F24FF
MIKHYIAKLILKFRKLGYKCFSTNKNIIGTCISYQPVVFRGEGTVSFGSNVRFGVINSPLFYNTYAYIEARQPHSNIIFGNNITINNNFSVVSERSITIKDNVLIGYNCKISDSNFHDLNAERRLQQDPNSKDVVIGDNVFLGNDVTILKGVSIGDNSVVAAGSIVTKSFPENVIIGGVPANIIRKLD